MNNLIIAGQFLLSLTFLVVLHELGHFLTAKWFKCRVDKFYLFFDFLFPLPGVLNFSLFKIKKGDTEYGLGWFPLGGYVSIAGMIDENMNTEQMKQPAQPWEFRSKPAWQRLIILMGGIIVNTILAIVIYGLVLCTWGEKFITNKNLTYGISVDSVGRSMGFISGDKIVSINGKSFNRFDDIPVEILLNKNCTVQIERKGAQKELQISQHMVKAALDDQKNGGFMDMRYPFVADSLPKDSLGTRIGLVKESRILRIDTTPVQFCDEVSAALEKYKNKTVEIKFTKGKDTIVKSFTVPSHAKLGIYLQTPDKFLNADSVKYAWYKFPIVGYNKAYDVLINKYVRQFPLIFSSEVKGYKKLGGFASMAKILPPVWDWEVFWKYTAFLSIILAFMNLLPIPALDGGHVLFTLAEMISGRKPGVKFLEYSQIVGIVIILGLMLYTNGNDLLHALGVKW
jgi:regulator of sigma E protease